MMRRTKFALTPLVFLLMLAWAPPASAAIPGLSIKFEDHPYFVKVGENFTMTVRVVNESGDNVHGYIRTQLYGNGTLFTYPKPTTQSGIVNLTYGGASANEIEVNLENGDNILYEFSILVDPEVTTLLESGASVYLRARISEENRSLAPSDRVSVWLIPRQGPEGLAPIKFTIGIVFSAAIVFSARSFQNGNGHAKKRSTSRWRLRLPSLRS